MLSLSFRASRFFLRLRGPSSNLPLIGRDPGDICHRRYRRFATAAFWVYFLYVTGVAGVVLPVENVRRKRSKLTKSWGDPLSPLFHEGAQNFKSINLSILPRWVAGFQAASSGVGVLWLGMASGSCPVEWSFRVVKTASSRGRTGRTL